ncbi:MAG: DUF1992 domain-containing protein [Caldilineales bacterium]|nr:DUF1992 domain-containing protein [Caldilineales bacterium]
MNDDPENTSPPRKPRNQTWENWVEEKIRAAMEQGEFDNLPGKGKPLRDPRNPFLAADQQLAHDLLRNSGHTLPWLDDRKEIDQRIAAAHQALQQAHTRYRQATPAQETAWEAAVQRFAQEIIEINRLIDIYNLKAPSTQVHKLRLILSEELARLPDHDR